MKWHYTTGRCLTQIKADRLIKCATRLISPEERPVVWFSTRLDWEPTATKAMLNTETGAFRNCTIDEMLSLDGGMFRIGVDDSTAPHDWNAFKRLSGIRAGDAERLHKVALKEGSFSRDWFVSFEPVPQDLWIALEQYLDWKWAPIPF